MRAFLFVIVRSLELRNARKPRKIQYNVIGHRTRSSIRQYFLVATAQLFSQQRANLAAITNVTHSHIGAPEKCSRLPKVTCTLVIFSFPVALSHRCKFVHAGMTIFVYKNITITFLLSRDVANATLCLR